MQKLFSLIRSHLFIFVFISIIMGDGMKKMLLRFMSVSILPIFSFGSFILSGLIFRSLMHFEIFFCVYVKEWPNFIFWHVAVRFLQHPLLKRLSFSPCVVIPFFTDELTVGARVYFHFLSCGVDLLSCVRCRAAVTAASAMRSEVSTWLLQLCFPFARSLWPSGVFCVSIQNVRFFVLILWKMPLLI